MNNDKRVKTSVTLSTSTRKLLGQMGSNMSRTLDTVFTIAAELMKEIDLTNDQLDELAKWAANGNQMKWAVLSTDLDIRIINYIETLEQSELMILEMRCNIINQGTNV